MSFYVKKFFYSASLGKTQLIFLPRNKLNKFNKHLVVSGHLLGTVDDGLARRGSPLVDEDEDDRVLQ